ncbi:MAG: IS4 family transposase [Acidobacteria bacterium]|nr:IS4 family transposase [Acidobacteriota bacterium]
MPSPDSTVHPPPTIQAVLRLYQQAASPEFFDQLGAELKLRFHNGVYSLVVVIWLMIVQRPHPRGTLLAVVQEAVRQLPPGLVRRPCKRLREGSLSSHTGAYNQARQKLPREVVERVSDRIFEQLVAGTPEARPGLGRRLFLLDGSTLLMPNTPELAAAYPPTSNQHGLSHWPVMRVLVAHEVTTGLAMRPQWGPVNGPRAVSEQQLVEQAIQRLPDGSVVMGDANFGVFSVAWAAQQHHYPMLLRLTPARATAFRMPLPEGTDCWVDWKPSRWDRKAHPELPLEACVRGRLIVRRVRPSDGSGSFLLYLFTTLTLPAGQVLELYGQRWNIETDLRSLKQTVGLYMLDCKSPAMVAKELMVGVTAYNLVRAVMQAAARSANLPPRSLSFSGTQDVLNAWLPYLATLPEGPLCQAELRRMMRAAAQCRLYKRRKATSYPRASWGRPRVFPSRKRPEKT